MRGKWNLLGEDVDQGLLLRSSKDQRVWVVGLGDLVMLELATMVDFLSWRANSPEVGGGVYIAPPRNVAVAGHLVRRLRSPGLETPAQLRTYSRGSSRAAD